VLPEIADYEIRRELIRVNKTQGLERLDTLKSRAEYVPLTTETMLLAAEFWAAARQRGRPTADDRALDGDMFLAAQAVLLGRGGDDCVIATTNVRHLSLFADAREWMTIETA
jgi:predicted nucleic acid-binding protein